jgi:hypothetical protein
MRTLTLLLLTIGLQSSAQERIDAIFEIFTTEEIFMVTTDHGDMKGQVHLEYNEAGEAWKHRVVLRSDNYHALADVCSKLVKRQLDLGSIFVEGEDLPRKRYLFYIENQTNFRIVMKDNTYYWTIKGNSKGEKSPDGVVLYELTLEGEDWERRDE